MSADKQEKSGLEKAGADLFAFAVDRQDTKALMAHLPEEAAIKRVTVEYELQILKIISVGWSITYYLSASGHKEVLSRHFWEAIHGFSQRISETTGLMSGTEIDYFQILRERLDRYVAALQQKPAATEPVAVIGPEFARICGNVDDVFTVMTGNRMFTATHGSVKAYLEAVQLI